MYVVIVANAPDFVVHPLHAVFDAADLIIAADGGGNALADAGIVPHLVVGDLDSLDPRLVPIWSAAGTLVQQFPPDKDETDLELALLAAVARGATRIDLLGVLGGRWDQGLANVALLALPELASCQVRLLASDQEAFLVRDHAAIPGQIGDTVSLLPLGGPVHGITTHGLQYPLTDATLYFERSRGVSNVIIAQPAHVTIRSGYLLVVHLLR